MNNPLNNSKEAIEEAIKGGYEVTAWWESAIFPDSAFWQSLGKQRGWNEYEDIARGNWDEPKTITHETIKTWLYHALRYFEVKLSGGSEEEFWKSLP